MIVDLMADMEEEEVVVVDLATAAVVAEPSLEMSSWKTVVVVDVDLFLAES